MPFVVCLGVLSHLNLEVFPHPQGSMNFNQRYCSTILLSKNILYTQSFIHIYKYMQLWIFLYTYVKEKRFPWELQMATFVPDLLDSAGPFASSIFEERCHFFGGVKLAKWMWRFGANSVAICREMWRFGEFWKILMFPILKSNQQFMISKIWGSLNRESREKNIAIWICNFWFQLWHLETQIPRKRYCHLQFLISTFENLETENSEKKRLPLVVAAILVLAARQHAF